MGFVVPALGQNFRWAAHSCNGKYSASLSVYKTEQAGFSSGVNPDEFKGTYSSGYDPVWEDLLLKHHAKPFHCMVGGGDQIYCDAITREPELQSELEAFACEIALTGEAGSQPPTGKRKSATLSPKKWSVTLWLSEDS